jgi:hypothetical protein
MMRWFSLQNHFWSTTPGREGVGEPVAEVDEPLLDGRPQLRGDVAPVPVPDGDQLHHVEVAGVLVGVDLGERGGEVVGPDGRGVEAEAVVAAGPGQVRQHTGGRRRGELFGGEAEVLVLAVTPLARVDVAVAGAERPAPVRTLTSAGTRRPVVPAPGMPPSPSLPAP